MKNEIQLKLEKIAFKRSKPFCYGCYEEAPSGRCTRCGSDDLMRLVPGVGCEYGTQWVIEHILENELETVDLEAAFEESVRDCYSDETKVGWMTFDTVALMKENDPVSWRCGVADYESQQESDGEILSFDNGGTYYSVQALQDFIEREQG